MKRWLAAVMIGLAALVLAPQAFAAWTVVETLDAYQPEYLKNHTGTFRIKLVCTSDASGTTYALTNPDVKGAYLYAVTTVPSGAPNAPAGTYSVSVTNTIGATLLTLAARSTSATETSIATGTLGGFPLIFGGQVALTTLGNTKQTTIYLDFVK